MHVQSKVNPIVSGAFSQEIVDGIVAWEAGHLICWTGATHLYKHAYTIVILPSTSNIVIYGLSIPQTISYL